MTNHNTATEQTRRWYERAGNKMIVTGTALAIAAAALSGCATNAEANGNQPTPKDPKTPVATEKVPETETPETPKTFEEQVEALKIKAGLSPEEAAKQFNDRIDEWAFAGATDENYDLWVASGVGLKPDPNFEDDVAAEQTPLYVTALFIPGYEKEQSLVNAKENLTTRNAAWLASWMRSYDFNHDHGTLEAKSIISEVKLISEDIEAGERVIYMAGYETSNADEAAFVNPDNRKNAEVNGRAWDDTLTLKTIDGYEYISKWED